MTPSTAAAAARDLGIRLYRRLIVCRRGHSFMLHREIRLVTVPPSMVQTPRVGVAWVCTGCLTVHPTKL
jgi:hypothetical protein